MSQTINCLSLWLETRFCWNHHGIRYNTIPYEYGTLMCARKPTWVRLIYRTEPTTKKCKTENQLDMSSVPDTAQELSVQLIKLKSTIQQLPHVTWVHFQLPVDCITYCVDLLKLKIWFHTKAPSLTISSWDSVTTKCISIDRQKTTSGVLESLKPLGIVGRNQEPKWPHADGTRKGTGRRSTVWLCSIIWTHIWTHKCENDDKKRLQKQVYVTAAIISVTYDEKSCYKQQHN